MRSVICAALMAMASVLMASALATYAEETRDHLKGGSSVSNISPAIVKQLAPTGKLRAAINLGNMVLAQKDSTSGELRGVTVELARELARRLDLPLELITFDAAGKVFAALNEGAWDIAFLAIEPVRAAEIAFTAPYVIIEGVYLVANDSPLRTVADVDRDGTRIGVNKGSAYDLYLTRTLKHATLVRGESGIDLFRKQKLEAAAGVKQPLVEYAKSHPDVRVMDGRFMEIRQAMGTPKLRYAGRDDVPQYLHAFVEEMKASGFVGKALARSNQPDAVVAPLAD
jgi:polar amino acid transport system substrate-binding protein